MGTSDVKAVELRELWRRCRLDGDEQARERPKAVIALRSNLPAPA